METPRTSANMADHDNIITLLANVNSLTEEFRALRDGTKADITTLFTKVNLLENKDIYLETFINQTAKDSNEHFYGLGQKIKSIDEKTQQGVQKTESNHAYYFRLALERVIIPLVIAGTTLILVKTGIIHIN